MKSNVAAPLAALCAVVYSSSVVAAPVDPTGANGSQPSSVQGPNGPAPDDAAIRLGIRQGIHQGLQSALSEALGINVDPDLVREEEVDQVESCIGDKVTNIIVECIKKENIPKYPIGGEADQHQMEEKHTESIQKCISPSALEHVEYCVGKLEVQRLGKDARILEELYQDSNLKKLEYAADHPTSAADQRKDESELQKVASPLFEQDWYSQHQESNSNNLFDSNPNSDATKLKQGNDDDLIAPAKDVEPLKVDPAKSLNVTATPTSGTPTPTTSNPNTNTDDKKKKDATPEAPFIKRKYGYGPEWKTAVGRRDRHPLPR